MKWTAGVGRNRETSGMINSCQGDEMDIINRVTKDQERKRK